MTEMSYASQLRHPSWQKRRLEMLDRAGFECSNCGDAESPLHVHHRQYFKGRKVWEYSDEELCVLCEDCHAQEHGDWDGIKKIISETGARPLYPLIAGFNHQTDWIDRENIAAARGRDALVYAAGLTAWIVMHLELEDIDRVAGFATSLMNEMAEPRMVWLHSPEVFGRN